MFTYFYHCLFCTVLGMSGVTGAALRETSFINRSLSALADVLAAIAEQRSHVPYRNSKLTHLLQDSVGEGLFWLLFNNGDFISQYFPLLCCGELEDDPMLTLLCIPGYKLWRQSSLSALPLSRVKKYTWNSHISNRIAKGNDCISLAFHATYTLKITNLLQRYHVIAHSALWQKDQRGRLQNICLVLYNFFYT